MNPLCPNCGSSEGLREVIYGLPDEPPDDSKAVLGGCCVEEGDPQNVCINCGWEGNLIKARRLRARE